MGFEDLLNLVTLSLVVRMASCKHAEQAQLALWPEGPGSKATRGQCRALAERRWARERKTAEVTKSALWPEGPGSKATRGQCRAFAERP